MDNSSRNIVTFIATITMAALLLMAARFYADSQKEPMPSTAEEAAPQPDTAQTASGSEQSPNSAPVQNDIADSASEEIPAITGAPSVNIEPSEPAQQEGSSAESSEQTPVT